MSKRLPKLPLFIWLITFAMNGCGHGNPASTIPSTSLSTAHKTTTGGAQFQPAVKNIFAAARGMVLSDNDLDSYITAPLSAADRATAHQYMKMMPPNMRGDFFFVDTLHGNRVFSNNADLTSSVVVTTSRVAPAGATSNTRGSTRTSASLRSSSARRHARDYSPGCSGGPPNPPSAPGGPYVRYVSKCNFTTGWGFVQIPSDAIWRRTPRVSTSTTDTCTLRLPASKVACWKADTTITATIPSQVMRLYGTTRCRRERT